VIARWSFVVLALVPACTTSETGDIDVLPSALPSKKPPPPPPPPPPACGGMMKCPTARPFCSVSMNQCVECLPDAGCMDPMHPFCDTLAGKCVECATNADCMGGMQCSPDGTCQMPPM
jgi:hypothetical protein